MEKIVTEQEFYEKTRQKQRSVVVFTTTWCPDCRRLEQFIDDIISRHDDKEWYEIDRDNLSALAEKQGVMGIPSLLVYEKGEKIAHLHSANAKTADAVENFLQSLPSV